MHIIEIDTDDLRDLIAILDGTPLRMLDQEALAKLKEQLQAVLDDK